MTWKKIAASVTVQYGGRAAGLIFSLLSVGLLTRYLGSSNYGDYTAAFAIANLIVTFSDFGFFWSTIQHLNGKDGSMESVKEVMGIRVTLTVLLILGSLGIVWMGSFPYSVKLGYTLLSLFIFSSSLNNILVALYQAEYRMTWPTIVDLLARLVNLALIFVGSREGYGLQWFVIAGSLTAFFNLAFNWIPLIKRHGLLLPKIRGVSWKKYYASVFLIGMMSLFSALFYKIDIVILSWVKGSVDVGIYGVAQKVVDLTVIFQSLFVSTLFPMLITRLQESEERFIKLTRQMFLVLTAVGIPFGFFGPLLTVPIINLISGSTFKSIATVSYDGHPITAAVTLSVLLGYVALSHFRTGLTTSLLASGEVKQLLIANVIATIANIGLNIWLIPEYSYLAAAATTSLTEGLLTAITYYYFIKRFPFPFPWKEVVILVAAGGAGSLFLYKTPDLPLFLRMFVACAIYAIILLFSLPQLKEIIAIIQEKRTANS